MTDKQYCIECMVKTREAYKLFQQTIAFFYMNIGVFITLYCEFLYILFYELIVYLIVKLNY